MTSFRILVTGSRTWRDAPTISKAMLDAVADGNPFGWGVILVHGDALGADRIAAKYAKDFGWSVEKHPVRWDQHSKDCPAWHEGERICKRAGMVRNEYMVSLGADICLAFIRDGSSGATACARMAKDKGIPLRRYLA